MKTLPKVRAAAFCAFSLSASIFAHGSQNFTATPIRALSFAERVEYQHAIEQVYWRHRIWPKDNPGPKPRLDAILSRAQLEQKVQSYLREADMIEVQRGSPISRNELQVEMDRMASHTKQPEVLGELFAALGNDPLIIAECLAKPLIVERMLTNAGRSEPLAKVSYHDASSSPRTGYRLPKISSSSSPYTGGSWTATSTLNAPEARRYHTSIWTGSEMIVWGGLNDPFPLDSGGRYNPATDSWTATNTIHAPEARWEHTAVWTGSEMIVWGGFNSNSNEHSGGIYNPAANTWRPMSLIGAPFDDVYVASVWTGSEMIIWGGDPYPQAGGKYNPGTDKWTLTSPVNAPEGRNFHTGVWTGSEMIVWGGASDGGSVLNTGGRYNPSTNTWTNTSVTNAPEGRIDHTAVWTGSEMIVWGGAYDGVHCLNTGGRYDPATDNWTSSSIANAPEARQYQAAVWTGTEMIVWGGLNDYTGPYIGSGGRYNPLTDGWTATSGTNAPSARTFHTGVWTGTEMVIWGGQNQDGNLNSGSRYSLTPASDLSITMLHCRSDAYDNTGSMDIDAPLSPVPDPTALAGQLSIGSGLVADGVTPLVFKVHLNSIAGGNDTAYYKVTFDPPAGGGLKAGTIDSHLWLLQNGAFGKGSVFTFAGADTAYAYISAIDTADVSLNARAKEISFTMHITRIDDPSVTGTLTFKVREPPVILVHGYASSSATWSKAFLSSLKQSRPADFVVAIDYGVLHSIPGFNATYDALIPLAAELDDLLTAQIENPDDPLNRYKDWALTRYDVVGHSQGGVLLRMLCQTFTPDLHRTDAPFAKNPPVSEANANRGRFRRVITIGSPQNGTTFLRYVLDLEKVADGGNLWRNSYPRFFPSTPNQNLILGGYRFQPSTTKGLFLLMLE